MNILRCPSKMRQRFSETNQVLLRERRPFSRPTLAKLHKEDANRFVHLAWMRIIRFCDEVLLFTDRRGRGRITSKQKMKRDANELRDILENSPETPELQAHRFLKKVEKSREMINFTAFYDGLEGDRTLDLCDAKSHLNIFCIISNYLQRFPLRFSFFPLLFRTQISMWYAAVCGGSCGQKRSPPFAGNGFPA